MDLQKIKMLLDFVGRSRIAELRVSEAGTTVIVRKAPIGPAAVSAATQPQWQSAPAVLKASQVPAGNPHVRAPLSGMVHQSNSPGAAPLVAEGDPVETGQPLCIVEAMKVFTMVSAPFGGVVKRIFFEDGQEVNFGDPLVEIA